MILKILNLLEIGNDTHKGVKKMATLPRLEKQIVIGGDLVVISDRALTWYRWESNEKTMGWILYAVDLLPDITEVK